MRPVRLVILAVQCHCLALRKEVLLESNVVESESEELIMQYCFCARWESAIYRRNKHNPLGEPIFDLKGRGKLRGLISTYLI
jgi:hypothetical protein